MLTKKIRQKDRKEKWRIENGGLEINNCIYSKQINIDDFYFLNIRNYQFSAINFQFLNDGGDAA